MRFPARQSSQYSSANRLRGVVRMWSVLLLRQTRSSSGVLDYHYHVLLLLGLPFGAAALAAHTARAQGGLGGHVLVGPGAGPLPPLPSPTRSHPVRPNSFQNPTGFHVVRQLYLYVLTLKILAVLSREFMLALCPCMCGAVCSCPIPLNPSSTLLGSCLRTACSSRSTIPSCRPSRSAARTASRGTPLVKPVGFRIGWPG